MKRMFYEQDCRRILDLMDLIEDKTGRMFHEINPDLDAECVKALDGDIHASFVINQLTKLYDEVNQ